MSVNITVNGKFAKHCRPYSLLDDPKEIKKAEEKERRKLRLLQVREESKKLAKKIRDEVNEEKKRELQKLQATKEKELECWRQHALQRKGEEYRAAIFQIGTAHQAAKRENEQRAEKQQGTYKDFKKQMAARKSQPGKVQFSCQTSCVCQQTLTTSANKQFKCTCTQTDETHIEDVHKRKRDFSFSSSESECEDEGYKEQTTLPQTSFSFSSTSDSTSTSLSNTQATQTSMFVPTKNKGLIKTPAVYLDVEVGTDDSVTISAPAEVQDKYAQYNRQFSSVIRVSPRKGHKEKESACENPSIQQSTTTNTLSSDSTAKQTEVNKTLQEKTAFTKAAPSKEKRFTIISDLVKKQQGNETSTANMNQGTTCPPVSQATSVSVTPHLSPRKQVREVPQRPPLGRPQPLSPRKASATSKSSRTITDNTQPVSSFAATTKSNTAIVSGSSSSGRVQFYDYNSKLAKERDQATAAVSVQRQQRDQSQPTAMQQAELEKQRERERQLEALKKCQQMEDRGQKALEREQVRRDCNELTEKLEALTREYPNQVPTNENQLHLFADKQLRKEGKMNMAVEKLLQRPTIITCSERNNPEQNINKPKATSTAANLVNELNVAALDNKHLPDDDVSSDSCCSILLGYVDDQSRLVKQDLQSNEAAQSVNKQKRLQNLLKRLDQLRTSLLEELKNESESKRLSKQDDKAKFSSAKEENLRQVIDSISEMRKEREQLLLNEKIKETKPLKTREKELRAKEVILEQKVREFYELQKQQNATNRKANKIDLKATKSEEEKEEPSSSSTKDKSENSEESSNNKENVICASDENPLEIIITVRGETKCVKIPQKSRRKNVPKKSPSKLSTLIRSPQTKKHTPKKKTPTTKPLGAQGALRRQNSYDSNSTSYMSLPSEMPNKIDDLTKQIAKEKQQTKTTTEAHIKQPTSKQDKTVESEISLAPFDTPRSNQPPRINPLIAQYVQRLLGMSRTAVEKLGVSSSEIDTPDSSIINITGNITNSDTLISDERLISIHNFMEENRSFIKDLEQSMRTQNNVSLENSMKMFDDIWRKRLKSQTSSNKNKKSQDNLEKKEITKTEKLTKESKSEEKTSLKPKQTSKDNLNQQMTKPLASSSKTMERKISSENLLKDLGKTLSSHYSSDDKESIKSFKLPQRSIQKSDKAIDARLSTDSSKNEPDSQIARYAKLTENCTHRIAELTELINRVREEKQRLLEVTLSSVSDNGRQSTEYLELPEGKSSTRHDQEDLTRVSSSSEETTQNKHSHSSDTLHEMPKLTSADKNKQITASRDSGIAESRPITALENRIDQEPISQTSSESTMPQPLRKMKPPPTLKRFSPQLPEEELAHELSTILEVDTPATSRINTAAGQSTTNERENASDTASQQPVKFPTFEQYIKQLDLDITQLNPEQSILLQQEFTTFLECLQPNRSPADRPQYTEFPSISAYIQHLSETDHQLGQTMEESLAQLRISGINPRNFPAVREYMKSNASKSTPDQEQQLLDTESLENITEEPTRTNTDDTASLDIEAELKRRKILKNSFRFSETKKQQIFSSTAHKDAAFFQEIVAAESGVDKLSTSGNTSDLLDTDLRRMVQQWPGEVRRKSKEIKILSSTTTSANASAIANSALRAASLDDSSKGTGQALNLRDFLTRELLKHANMTGSSSNSSSDESLRSHFLHSLIGSLTPRTPGAASKSGAMTLDRQKTSTPVPMLSSTASSRSNASSQLFSGESRLSSVHYQDRSVRFFTSDGDKADQSSE